ncbi:sensor histidine kinase [Actinomycetospora aeridis]|uniref:histidine kinase n=1 Tax=Actinomycetospora aeridis TaxID=3129231 RepID=A0ABU8N1W9_9PSEU
MRRSPSLRSRVALASGLASLVVVVLVGVLASVLLTREQTERLDRSLVPGSPAVLGTFASTRADLAVTLRGPTGTRRVSGPELPLSPLGIPTSVDVGGVAYRIRTAPGPTPGVVVTVGATEDDTRARVADRQRWVTGLGVVAVALAAGLGWVFAGRAVAPMRRLTVRASTLDETVADPADPPPTVRADGSRESEELAEALTAMLARLHAEQERSTASLHAARDFAAAARHELRTPLTAMRTDLEVLQAHPDLPERVAVLADVLRAQARVEATLTALGQLAAGDLPEATDQDAVGVADLLRLAAEDARRAHPALDVVVDEPPDGAVRGSREGLRMALANAVVNAVRHGRAGSVRLGAHAGDDGGVVLTVDDDGTGLPADERDAVLGRFVRGSTAGAPGSGLGLALVAQQAARHGGEVRLEDAPTGGLRVSLAIGPDRAG